MANYDNVPRDAVHAAPENVGMTGRQCQNACSLTECVMHTCISFSALKNCGAFYCSKTRGIIKHISVYDGSTGTEGSARGVEIRALLG